jgi:hypothetical protein
LSATPVYVPNDIAVAEIRQVAWIVAETPKVVVTVVVAEAFVAANPSARNPTRAAVRAVLVDFKKLIADPVPCESRSGGRALLA